MIISYNTIEMNSRESNGYGYAGSHIVRSLNQLGFEVETNNPECNTQFWFSQPEYWNLNPDRYNIVYVPWESSKLPRGWVAAFNSASEVWTTSDICAEWYKDAGITKPIHVFQHGIEPAWKPLKRRSVEPIKFLHIGEPAPRKGGQLVLDAFRMAFSDASNVHLTIKAYTHSAIRVYETGGFPARTRSIVGNIHDLPNVSLIEEEYGFSRLIGLYHDHDVLVYPSWGEGFGFIPLQALATGMPTICTAGWAPYRKFLGPLKLRSDYVDSPWQNIHPGKMFQPDLDHLVSLMRMTVENFDHLSEYYYSKAPAVHEAYNWENLTRDAFAHLEN